MKIAVLSGKGGAGKTFTAVNLAYSIGSCTYVDCDVEEPNGDLFFHSEKTETREITQLIPAFDAEKCTGCRECVNHCRFNALIYIKHKPMVFKEVCHSCGLCSLVCHENAIRETQRPVGVLNLGKSGTVRVISGVVNPGEASGIPLIKAAKKSATPDQTVIYDCPPGSACPVQESMQDADYCILVAEPTAFGFHNFLMAEELVRLHKKPFGVIIDKMDAPYEPLESFCREKNIPILMRIPYQKELASLISQGKIAAAENESLKNSFQNVFYAIGGKKL